MANAAPTDLQKFKFMYIVNLHLQEGQTLPTFTPVPRDGETGKFPRISGQTMNDMALYYTDTAVDEINIVDAVTIVLKGGPNIVRPDEDDSALMAALAKSGRFTEDAFEKAAAASDELKAVMAADGHFRFSLV